MECSICIEPMLTSKFIAVVGTTEDVVDKDDPSCIRMRCGHAFHAACCLASMRSGMACATCREFVVRSDSQEDFFEMLIEQDSEISENPLMFDIDSLRATARVRDKSVRKARQLLNAKTKKYNILCEKLRSDRRLVISKVLKEFRATRRTEHRLLTKDVVAAMRGVVRAETAAITNMSTNTTISSELIKEYVKDARAYEYDAIEHIRCKDEEAADPINEKFWR